MELTITTIQDLPLVATEILKAHPDKKVFLFNGEMGVGKTTLIKALCQILGVEDEVSSPTFSIVNEYKGTCGSVFHFDFYRLEDTEEAFNMGAEEYFFSQQYCLIEWPEIVDNLLPASDKYVSIDIFVEDGARTISF